MDNEFKFDDFYEKANPLMAKIAAAYIWNKDEAVDFVQTMWLEFLKRFESQELMLESDPIGYIVVATRNRALNWIRDSSRQSKYLAGSADDLTERALSTEDTPEQLESDVDWEQLKAWLKDCLDDLKPIYRVPLLLQGEGLKGEQIAEILRELEGNGIPAGTVRRRQSRAKELLRACLRRKGVHRGR